MIITPTVAKEVQAQFGCSEVPGAALENEGGRGSALAHWEYKWFQVQLGCCTNASHHGTVLAAVVAGLFLWCKLYSSLWQRKAG
jgi:hypothetical protein